MRANFLTFLGTLVKCSVGKNVVYVMIDDFGWGDFGIHGSKLETPNLDSLASSGVVLDQYYTQPVCSPTRSSLLTGRYPIRLGLQHNVILAGQESGIPKKYKLLPQELKSCGYSTHMIGKWHAGHAHRYMLPANRGFDTFYGYLQGAEDHYSRVQCQGHDWCGIDFATENGPTNETFGTYGTDIYSLRAQKVLDEIKEEQKPFFLYYSLQNVHYPLQAPEHYRLKFDWIKDPARRNYAAMVSIMDEAVGDLVKMLKFRNLWDDTLLIVTADNGGETRSGGNNFPLRSQKWSLYEGGVRANSFINGGLVQKTGKYSGLFHVSDWRETILDAMECEYKKTTDLDGVSQWEAIQADLTPPRFSILHNIDPLKRARGHDTREWVNSAAAQLEFDINAQSALRFGDWKILTGDPAQGVPDGNIPPPEVGNKKLYFGKNGENKEYWIRDMEDNFYQPSEKKTRLVHLFNIGSDPHEKLEISDDHAEIVKMGLSLLSMHNETAVAPQWPKLDPRSKPAYREGPLQGFWWPWK